MREALTLAPHIPIIRTDARSRDAVKTTLITLVEHALTVRMAVPGWNRLDARGVSQRLPTDRLAGRVADL